MLQSLLRNWLLGQAREQMRAAAAQAATGAADQAQPADEQAPPERKREVCHVGLVFALPIEAGGLIDRLSGVIRIEGHGFVAREGGLDGRRLVIVESGAGRAAAARATTALVAGHHPQWIISAGFAGGLHDSLAQGDLLMADRIVDQTGRVLDIDLKIDRQAQRHLHVGRLLTMDRVIDTAEEKAALGRQFDALAVDMETIAVAEVCQEEKIRFLSVRVIIDALAQSARRYRPPGQATHHCRATGRRGGSHFAAAFQHQGYVATEGRRAGRLGAIGELSGGRDRAIAQGAVSRPAPISHFRQRPNAA